MLRRGGLSKTEFREPRWPLGRCSRRRKFKRLPITSVRCIPEAERNHPARSEQRSERRDEANSAAQAARYSDDTQCRSWQPSCPTECSFRRGPNTATISEATGRPTPNEPAHSTDMDAARCEQDSRWAQRRKHPIGHAHLHGDPQIRIRLRRRSAQLQQLPSPRRNNELRHRTSRISQLVPDV